MADAVGRLHGLLEEARPTSPGGLDEPLVDECRSGAVGQKRRAPSENDHFVSDDDLAEEPGEAKAAKYIGAFALLMEQEGEKSDAELGAMARAVWKRRQQPY